MRTQRKGRHVATIYVTTVSARCCSNRLCCPSHFRCFSRSCCKYSVPTSQLRGSGRPSGDRATGIQQIHRLTFLTWHEARKVLFKLYLVAINTLLLDLWQLLKTLRKEWATLTREELEHVNTDFPRKTDPEVSELLLCRDYRRFYTRGMHL